MTRVIALAPGPPAAWRAPAWKRRARPLPTWTPRNCAVNARACRLLLRESVDQLQAEFQHPAGPGARHGAISPGWLARRVEAGRGIEAGERGMIHHIERFPAELQAGMFADL